MSDRPDPGTFRARVRRGVGAALIVLLAAAAITVVAVAVTPGGAAREVAPPDPGSSGAPMIEVGAADGSVLYVHVLGEVAHPGLYELSPGDRVVDAIAAAGGLTDDADPGAVNLARPVSDGEQLAVPAVGESPAPGSAGGEGAASDGRVDLNTADVAALDTLPRVGPAIAQRIIDWREQNGPFSSVDDLLAISGIGEKTVEALRPLVVP
ncbi:ComEA family DNA-binding protein [Homoserinibacter sp. GY 40078]|uniref:ComEA family DNA-binding protein n=1 Tax=Homoserinibacter sp. GY 40078 TaxID=2603275 RepID=UPI0011C9362D|nr:ComEA family DNA-binding protein [Homoserinibacter sp. GY 40078]TXK17151.1 ComEA family DNA-binding protein [Homoserinibacter sp. GY 40078]